MVVVCSSVEVEPGDAGQHNEDVTDVDPGIVGKPQPDPAAATCHRGHAPALCQQEGQQKSCHNTTTHTHAAYLVN